MKDGPARAEVSRRWLAMRASLISPRKVYAACGALSKAGPQAARPALTEPLPIEVTMISTTAAADAIS